MGAIKLKKWDSAEHLKSDEDMALHIETRLEKAGSDAAFTAKRMTQLAKETELRRESLHKALSGEGDPGFSTIFKAVSALGITLHAESTRP